MNQQPENQRIPWTARINIRPAAREQVTSIAKIERLSMATVIGQAIDLYLSEKSST